MKKLITCLCLALVGGILAQAQITPIYGGQMQTDLDAGGHTITNLSSDFLSEIGAAPSATLGDLAFSNSVPLALVDGAGSMAAEDKGDYTTIAQAGQVASNVVSAATQPYWETVTLNSLDVTRNAGSSGYSPSNLHPGGGSYTPPVIDMTVATVCWIKWPFPLTATQVTVRVTGTMLPDNTVEGKHPFGIRRTVLPHANSTAFSSLGGTETFVYTNKTYTAHAYSIERTFSGAFTNHADYFILYRDTVGSTATNGYHVSRFEYKAWRAD